MILWIVLSSLFVSAISFVGSTILLSKRSMNDAYASSVVSFAAGVMLSAALLDLLPEALEENPDPIIFTALFAGVVFFFFLERFVLWFHHHHGAHGIKPSTVLILVGDGVHNIIDGVVLAAAFIASPALGITTLFAISAHEIPQELADFSVLTANGMSRKKALMWNFLSGLTALLGALLGIFFLETFEALHWALLAFSAGMFLYIACADLIPELHGEFQRHGRWRQTLPFVLGAALLIIVTHLVEGFHSH